MLRPSKSPGRLTATSQTRSTGCRSGQGCCGRRLGSAREAGSPCDQPRRRPRQLAPPPLRREGSAGANPGGKRRGRGGAGRAAPLQGADGRLSLESAAGRARCTRLCSAGTRAGRASWERVVRGLDKSRRRRQQQRRLLPLPLSALSTSGPRRGRNSAERKEAEGGSPGGSALLSPCARLSALRGWPGAGGGDLCNFPSALSPAPLPSSRGRSPARAGPAPGRCGAGPGRAGRAPTSRASGTSPRPAPQSEGRPALP